MNVSKVSEVRSNSQSRLKMVIEMKRSPWPPEMSAGCHAGGIKNEALVWICIQLIEDICGATFCMFAETVKM